MLLLYMPRNQTAPKIMTCSTDSLFVFDFHHVKLESNKPTKIHPLTLGNQILWVEVPFIYLKTCFTNLSVIL